MALAAYHTPPWLSAAVGMCYLISSVGFLVNYSLRKKTQKKVTTYIKAFYRSLRSAPLQVVQSTIAVVLAGFRRIYGSHPLRIGLTSLSISTVYFLIAMWSVFPTPVRVAALRTEKARIERQSNPSVYDATIDEWKRARDWVEMGEAGGRWRNFDPRSVELRAGEAEFDKKWRLAIRDHPDRRELALVRLWEGNRIQPGVSFSALLALIAWNGIIDVSAWAATIFALRRFLRRGASWQKSLQGVGLILATITISFLASLYLYSRFLEGYHTIFALLIFGIAGTVLFVAVGLGVFGGAVEEDSKIGRVVIRIFGVVGIGMGANIAWHIVTGFREAHRLGSSFVWPPHYLADALALSTVLPAAVCAATLLVAVSLKAFSETSRHFVLAYLRIVFRLNKPALLTLTLTPGAVGLFVDKVMPIMFTWR